MKKIIYIFTTLLMLISLAACNSEVTYECTPISVFDTVVTMVFYDDSNYKTYYNDIKAKFNEINRISDDFNINTDKNNVYVLNDKREVESSLLKDMLTKALELKEETNGYFNPFIGRLTHKWKDAIKNNNVLSSTEIEEELSLMNNTTISFDGDIIKLEGQGNIDLGAFAKGYALEWAKNYLDEKEVDKYYINCGSSSIYIANKELNISLSKPYSNDSILDFKASNIGIATSSPKYQYSVINGEKYHHLINPFTGYPSNIYDSVNVIGNNNMKNDIYSTAFFSMSVDDVKEYVKDKDINVILYKDNEIIYQKEKLWVD
ncbi:MAG: FAD:protein FMN transferase [Acholeplasmatales bacterium]|nr:FAD:protein FMN transferase [Acholeplasmatales bacterium]